MPENLMGTLTSNEYSSAHTSNLINIIYIYIVLWLLWNINILYIYIYIYRAVVTMEHK